jgi:hypothetical protein
VTTIDQISAYAAGASIDVVKREAQASRRA